MTQTTPQPKPLEPEDLPIFSNKLRTTMRASFAVSRCLFLRAMGLVYFCAFLSLAVQIKGLVGGDGVLPAAPFLEAARAQLGAAAYWQAPTVFYFGASDFALQAVCYAGVALSLAVMAGMLPLPCLALCWVLYLSLATVCRTFLNFQWDALLLEAGFLALFMAPWRQHCRLSCPGEPPRLARWLLIWLLFRLMFASGVVKLASGDPSWWNLRALDVHYETQPIPSWTAWYAHQMPGWFHSISTALMFFIELVVPFGLFGPQRLRRIAAAILIGFQIVIVATGNYAFFNLLTMALCLPLLDDGVWPRRWRDRAAAPSARALRWTAVAAAPLVLVLVLVSVASMTARLRLRLPWPAPLMRVADALAPFRIVNAYGLFAVMTRDRPEIVVEGSRDGRFWEAYEFRWKPGDVARRPPFVAPHQPRLDWQMWFAALGDSRSQPWFQGLVVRLLQGSPEVLGLLERNPFPDAPPAVVRAVLYDYRFTDAATREATGAWWRREPTRLYSPPQSLRR